MIRSPHLFALVGVFMTMPVLAHGPAPTVLDAVGNGRGGLAAVRTNIGLATPHPDGGHRYICPAQWGEEERFPPITRLPGGAFVLATEGVVHRSDGCTFQAFPIEGWSGRYGGMVDGVLLERHAEGGRFWDIRSQARILFSVTDGHVDSHRVDGEETYFGRSRGPARIHRWSSVAGVVPLLVDGPQGDYLSIRTLDPLTFILSTEEGPQLYRVENGRAEQIGGGMRAVHGPVRVDGALYFLADGILHRWLGGQTDVVGPVDWTCLLDIEGQVYACAQRNLHRVDTGEWRLEGAVFQLDDFVGVDPDCPREEPLRTECVGQWFHYGAEAGLIEFTPDGGTGSVDGSTTVDSEDVGPPATHAKSTGSGAGCAQGGSREGPLAVALLVGLLGLLRRPSSRRYFAR